MSLTFLLSISSIAMISPSDFNCTEENRNKSVKTMDKRQLFPFSPFKIVLKK